jgi:hypothetical protein
LIVGVRHGIGQIHVLAAADFQHGVAGDDVFSSAARAMVGLMVEQGMAPSE